MRLQQLSVRQVHQVEIVENHEAEFDLIVYEIDIPENVYSLRRVALVKGRVYFPEARTPNEPTSGTCRIDLRKAGLGEAVDAT